VEDRPAEAILRDNLLGKPSTHARQAALYRLRQLYGVGGNWPICVVLRRLWQRDPAGRPILALHCALARDPTLRDGAGAILDAPLGERVRWPAIAGAFETVNPGRLGEETARSVAQHAASSWTQAGFLKGAVRKERVRAQPTPAAAAYAALIAGFCGFGGRRLLECRWLDRPARLSGRGSAGTAARPRRRMTRRCPPSRRRRSDHHTTLAEKRAARAQQAE
jgi:hypothetical protein